MTHHELMQRAIELSVRNVQQGGGPFGAVIARHGEVLAEGVNRVTANHDPTAHAELLCLREGARRLGDWRLRGCTLYVTLEPCPMCAGAMVMSQLTRCVYGAADERQGCCGSVYDLPGDAALSGVTSWQSGVMAEECGQLMRDFFAGRRG